MSDFESRLEQTLKSVRHEHERSLAAELPAARQRVMQRVRRHQFRFVITSTAVTAAALVAVLFATQTNIGLDDDSLPPAGPAPTVVAVHDLKDETASGLIGSRYVVWLATQQVGEGNVGIADGGVNLRLWTQTNNRFRKVYAGSGFAGDWSALAANDGSAFVISPGAQTLTKVDVAGGQPETVAPTDMGASAVGASDSTLWYSARTEGRARAVPLDARSLDPLGPPHDLGPGEIELLASADQVGGGVWAITSNEGVETLRLLRDFAAERGIFPPTAILLPEADESTALAFTDAAVWVVRHGQANGSVLRRIDLGDSAEATDLQEPGIPKDVAAGRGSVWLLSQSQRRNVIYEIDPETNEVLNEPIDVGSGGPGEVAVGAGYVWATNVMDHTLYQIDPAGVAIPTPSPSATRTDEDTEDKAPTNEDANNESPQRDEEAFAIWPEHEADTALQNCEETGSESVEDDKNESSEERQLEESRRNAEAMIHATAFADEVLGWKSDLDVEPAKPPGEDVAFVLAGPEGNELRIDLKEVAPSCWVVTHANPEGQDKFAPTGLSVEKSHGTLSVAVDLEHRNIEGDIATVNLEVPDADGTAIQTSVVEPNGEVTSFQATRFPAPGPSYFLLYFKAADGTVLNALGMALPAGDFSAG
jgi:DNA-binding beta-propeller fold protein YncE